MNTKYKEVFSNLIFAGLALALLLPAPAVFAQKKGAQSPAGDLPRMRVAPYASTVYSDDASLLPAAPASQVRDTLRNFVKGNTVFRIPASAVFMGEEGWIHGTNSFGDIAKATRISLPDGVTTGQLEEVHVTFIHKANQVTTENYFIDVYDVDSNGGPGTLLASQQFSYQFVDADEDLNTPAITTLHLLDTPVTVSEEFFISVDLGPYGPGEYANIAIASTDFLGRFVDEDWEQLNDGTWVNMSESWFSTADDGWNMWLEAVVDYQENTGTGPAISHTPVTTADEGADFVVTADLSSSSGIDAAAIAYRSGGSTATPTVTAMTNIGGSTWQATIPGSFVDLNGFQYEVGASDTFGNASTTNTISVEVSSSGVTRNLAIQGASSSDYRLFSVPFNLDNTSAASLLEDDLGSYDPAVWRMFSLNADQSYSEFPGVGAVRPGTAFWLALRESGSITTGAGSSTSLANSVSVPLNPGWTFVGTPYNFAIPQGQLSLASGNAVDIRAFNGAWNTLSGSMQPFAGYAVAATESDQLLIAPFAAPAKTAESPTVSPASTYTWSIGIRAASETARDEDNVLAVAPGAAPDWDQFDRPEPPVIGTYISVYFPHDDWGVPFERFNTDVRPATGAAEQWTFEVHSNVAEAFPLEFTGIAELPATLEVLLIDNLLHRQQDLRAQPRYIVNASEEPYPSRFTLLVGPADEVDALAADQARIPVEIEIESFPNPFKGASNVKFGLAERSNVTLNVYDSLGRRTATLIEGEVRDAGYHTTTWTGKNDAGLDVASGVYFYVLQAGNQSTTRQIIFLK